MNRFDLKLYEFATRLMAERSENEQASLDAEVRRFRATNASLRGRMSFYSSTAIPKAHRLLRQGTALGKRKPLG